MEPSQNTTPNKKQPASKKPRTPKTPRTPKSPKTAGGTSITEGSGSKKARKPRTPKPAARNDDVEIMEVGQEYPSPTVSYVR